MMHSAAAKPGHAVFDGRPSVGPAALPLNSVLTEGAGAPGRRVTQPMFKFPATCLSSNLAALV